MKETPTKENSLYLTIKQVYFDQIIAGTKKEEYREIKDTTFKKYLDTDEKGNVYISDSLPIDEPVDIMMYYKGEYPFFPKPYAYLNLAVGYAKERDTATVEVVDITFQVHKGKNGEDARFDYNEETGAFVPNVNGDLAIWLVVYHLGEIVEVNRKKQ